MLGNCIAPHGSFLHRWPLSEVEMVVGGGGTIWFRFHRLSTLKFSRSFSIHTQQCLETQRRHLSYSTRWLQLPFFGQRGHKLRTEETLWLCSIRNCATTEKLDQTQTFGWEWAKMADNWTFGGRSNTFFGQVCGCQSPDNILIRISIKSTFNWFPNADHVFDWLSYGGNPIFALLTTSSGLKMIRKEFYFQIKRRPFGTMADLRFQEGSPWNDWISTGRIFWPN